MPWGVAGRYRPLPGDAALAAWVRSAIEEDDTYAYETLALDLCRRWGFEDGLALARALMSVANYGSGEADPVRLYDLLGWEQSVLFAAWFERKDTWMLARELGYREPEAYELKNEETASWLAEMLAPGPRPQLELEDMAAGNGIGPGILHGAAMHLGVIAEADDGTRVQVLMGVAHENVYEHEHGRRAAWIWHLPGEEQKP